MRKAIIAQLNIYPIKSCAGTSLDRAILEQRGLAGDRHWMLIDSTGRFLSQREMPRLALVKPDFDGDQLRVSAPGMPTIRVAANFTGASRQVRIWDDCCAAIDAGDEAGRWFSEFLHAPLRLVRFDPSTSRYSDSKWSGGVGAQTAFADGFALLVISEASLADLNARLERPLPMNRFRPNIVLAGIEAYEEDRIAEVGTAELVLRMVKPCARCSITTVEQDSGEFTGAEPLKTLRSYRWSRELRGILFGQNVIPVKGIGAQLKVGQELDIR